MTTGEAYIDFKKQLQTIYEDREAGNITDWIFENVTGLKKWERRVDADKKLTEEHLIKLKKYLEELRQSKPVQYVLNEAWFYKRKFYVDENVLIPRPETEELVEWIVKDSQSIKTGLQIIDIGAGSGCISVSLKKELPSSNVTAIDISQNVEKVIKKNAEDLNAEIDFLLINFLNKNEWASLRQYDIIVSNPPYIPVKEKEILSKNVTDYEPDIALFVEDNNPFIFYEKIAQFAREHLKEHGKIYVETHEKYAVDVKTIFENAGFISTVRKDIYGKERMVKAARV